MTKSCTIRPQVRDKSGNVVDSILWTSLRSVLSYDKTKEAYLTVKGSDFEKKYGKSSKIKLDENGEPTYNSIANLPEFSDIIDIDSRVAAEERKLKEVRELDATRSNIDKLDAAAIRYNASDERDEDFVAATETYTGEDGKEKVKISIQRNGGDFIDKVKEMVNKRRMNKKLASWLEKKGIKVEVLSELQQKIRRATGVTDFDASLVAANGIATTVQIARGHRGQDALPEEFAHIVVEALHDSPIIKRLYTLVLDNNLAQAILGDEYEAYLSEYEHQLREGETAGYKKVFADNANRGVTLAEHTELEKMMAYEAIGHLVYERMLLAENATSENRMQTSVENLISRLKPQFEQTLSAYDLEALYDIINEAQALSSDFANSMMKGSLFESVKVENIATTARFYQLEDKVAKKKDLLDKLIQNVRKRIAIYDNNADAFDKKKQWIQVQNLEEKWVTLAYEDGITDWVSDSLAQVRELSDQIRVMTESRNVPIEKRIQILRNVNGFVQAYSHGLKIVNDGVYGGILERDAERESMLNELSSIVGTLRYQYDKFANPMFVEIIKQFVGDDIMIPFSKMTGKTYTAEDIAQLADKDISIFDRWLDAAYDCGDWGIRIMDNIAKKHRGQARLNAIRLNKELIGAYNKLKKAGYKDTDFMYDPTAKEGGKPVHRYIDEKQAGKLPQAQREYYYTVMDIKRRADLWLPDGTTELLNAPVIRKSYVERLADNIKDGDAGAALHDTIETIKESFIQKSDDSDYGGAYDTDFDDKRIDKLPIYFIHNTGDLADLSHDTTSTMMMYINMASNYHAMSQCVDTLEFMRDNMMNRRVQMRNGKTIDFKDSNAYQRMMDWFNSQVYGRYMRDNTMGDTNISWVKTANALNQLTALQKFALNLLSGISNVLTGSVMMRIESVAGQWFKFKDVAKADGIFWAQMKDYVGDIGQLNKTSKLALFDEMFNVLQDWESTVSEKTAQRTRLGRLATSNSLYFINNGGELWMQNRTALALANTYKMKDAGGNIVTLWDALEVRVDDNGVGHLKVKDGYTKEDGSIFGDDDILEFTNKAKAINQRMHGIYNYEDRNAAQATFVGRLALLFRKWIKPAMNRRWGHARYNYDLKDMDEGFYRTTGRFLATLVKDMKNGQLHALASYRDLSEYERKNITRAATEVAHLILLTLAYGLLSGLGDDDDDEFQFGGGHFGGAGAGGSWGDDKDFTDSYAFDMITYQTKRLQSEIASMSISWNTPKEVFNIIKSPSAAISTFENTLNIVKIVSPAEWMTEVENGAYRGRSKAYKDIVTAIPMVETVRRGLNPKEQIAYFK